MRLVDHTTELREKQDELETRRDEVDEQLKLFDASFYTFLTTSMVSCLNEWNLI